MGIDHSSLGILTVELPPEPEMGSELKAAAEVVRDEEDCDVVVDFSSADIVTSSSISKLLRLRKLLIDRGHRLILCSTAPATEGIFEVVGLDVVFEFAADKSSALASIKHTQPVNK
jgi:anti-anti-sigma regulatory factor